MEPWIAVLLVSLACLCCGAGIAYSLLRPLVINAKQIGTTHRRRTGRVILGPGGPEVDYDIITFDDGKHWYSLDPTQDGIAITGPADPNLLRWIESYDNLVLKHTR